MVQSLADGEDTVSLRVGSATTVYVERTPVILQSPVSYDETIAVKQEIEFDDDDADENSSAATEIAALVIAAEREPIAESN